MAFRLRYRQHDFELTDGQFVIGRSAECQLSLDDPLVSRKHALLVVADGEVTVKDLGSRNGLQVNGTKLDGSKLLDHNDIVTIGSQELVLMRVRDAVAGATATQVKNPAPTQRADAFALLGDLAEKAFALGKGVEAERILATRLHNVLRDAEFGREISSTQSTQASLYAARLAASTGKGEWINYIVKLHHALGQAMPAEVVDQLYEVLRKTKDVDLTTVRDYIELMRSRAADWGPAERFLLRRIEGLERLAASR